MNNKYYIELNLDNAEVNTLPEDVLMAQIRILAHRLDKEMQFSQSRKKTFTISELSSLKIRLETYRSKFSIGKADYIWAEMIITLYEKAIKDQKLFNYPWLQKHANNIAEEDFERFMTTRRSIRFLKDDIIPEEKIRKIINYGLWAPSSCNNQSLRYTVIRSKDVKQKITAGGFTGKEGYCIIAVIADYRIYDDRDIDCLIHDSAAAVQNILLAAHYYELGTCYVSDMGVNLDKYRNILGIAEHEKITALIWLGEYEKDPMTPARRNIYEVLKFI